MTLLTDLVRKQTSYGLVASLGRTIDKVVEEIAHDLLRDPDFRAELQALVRVAFQQTLKELNDPTPPAAPEPSRDVDLLKMIREQRDLIATLRQKEQAE